MQNWEYGTLFVLTTLEVGAILGLAGFVLMAGSVVVANIQHTPPWQTGLRIGLAACGIGVVLLVAAYILGSFGL